MEFTPHRAGDDAYATMRVAEAMCKEEGCTLFELLKKYEITAGRIENYEITLNTSTSFEAYKQERENAKLAREKARMEFHNFADREKRKRAKEGKLKGKTICFSHSLELQTALAKRLLTLAFSQGAYLTYRAEDCDLYVCFENETGGRVQSVVERNGKILTPEAFVLLIEQN